MSTDIARCNWLLERLKAAETGGTEKLRGVDSNRDECRMEA